MTRLALLVLAVALLACGAVVVSARESHRASAPVFVRVSSTVTTEDLRPLLDASIAAADQAAKVCEGP